MDGRLSPDDAFGDELDDDEQEWRPRGRTRAVRIIAFVVIVAMVLALVIPVIVRISRRPEAPQRSDGIVTLQPVETSRRGDPFSPGSGTSAAVRLRP